MAVSPLISVQTVLAEGQSDVCDFRKNILSFRDVWTFPVKAKALSPHVLIKLRPVIQLLIYKKQHLLSRQNRNISFYYETRQARKEKG